MRPFLSVLAPVLLQLADWTTTVVGLSLGLQETNSFMVPMYEHPATILAVKAAAGLAVGFWFAWLRVRFSNRLTQAVEGSLNGAMIAVVVGNARLIGSVLEGMSA